MLDVFNGDAFKTVSLTTAINKLPYIPGRLGRMGIFKPKGITTTVAVVEERQGKLYLIPTAARGAMPNAASGKTRAARTFNVPHMPHNDAVMADDVQGVRAFGTEDATEAVTQLVNDKLETARQSHEVTHEYHRIGAIQGNILDADGATSIYNLFTEFGITEIEVEFDFSDATTDVKQLAQDVTRQVQEALGATPYGHIHAMCGNTWFDQFVAHSSVAGAYERYRENEFARKLQSGEGGFDFAGIIWENYRGSVGDVDFIDADTARFFPVGAPDLFQEIMSPANFIEAVNTVGKRLYVKQERMKFDVGVELHTQSNVLSMCTRPRCLVKGTRTMSSASGA